MTSQRINIARPWTRTIDIKTILYRYEGDGSDSTAATIAHAIATLFQTSVPDLLDARLPTYDADLQMIVDQLEQVRGDDYADDPSYSVRQDVDDRLEELYDWADRERVWLGL